LRWWQITGIVAAMVLTSAAPSARPSEYLVELIFASFLQFIHLADFILIPRSFPAEHLDTLKSKFEKYFEATEPGKAARIDRFAIYASLWVTVVSVLLNLVSY